MYLLSVSAFVEPDEARNRSQENLGRKIQKQADSYGRPTLLVSGEIQTVHQDCARNNKHHSQYGLDLRKPPCELQFLPQFELFHSKAFQVLVSQYEIARGDIPIANARPHRQMIEMIPYTRRPRAPVPGSTLRTIRANGIPSTIVMGKTQKEAKMFVFDNMLIVYT